MGREGIVAAPRQLTNSAPPPGRLRAEGIEYMSRSSSPARLPLPAVAVAVVALFAAACSGSPANPNSPLSLSSNTNLKGGGAPQSSAGKVDVCHLNDTGGFQLINVSANALQSHLAHGDGQPNGAVPGGSRQVFGASCQVIQLTQHTLTLVSGASGGTGSLDPAISYAQASGGTGTAIILDTHPAFHSLPGARWVSWATIKEGSRTYGAPHDGDDITYSIGFTLPAGATDASLSGTFYADNRGDGFLNGAPIGGHNPLPFGGGFTTPVSINASSGFVTGANTLSVKVQDQGGVSGVTFKATITYWAQ
jgi:hypothetical protein